jgi:hypothetical protein
MAEEVAWGGLEDVPRVLPLDRHDLCSGGELLDDFWSKIGYPTADSRHWERRAAAAGSAQVQLGRPRSLSPTPAEKPSVRVRPASASPTGLRLPKPQVRLKGWRGPLPPRRITPPTVFADFVEAAVKRTVGRSAEAFIEEPRQPAEVFEPS